MADDTTIDAAPEEAAKKSLPIKTIIVIAVVMLIEGVVLGGLFMAFGSSPGTAQAEEAVDDETIAEEEAVEIELIAGKFQNRRQGAQSFLYDTTIYILVKRKNLGTEEEIEKGGGFEAMVESHVGRIRGKVVSIIATAAPAHLNETEHETLKRQLLTMVNEMFGEDPDGDPYVLDVVIGDWKEFPSDG